MWLWTTYTYSGENDIKSCNSISFFFATLKLAAKRGGSEYGRSRQCVLKKGDENDDC